MAYVYRHIRIDKNQPFYIGISKGNDSVNSRANSDTGRNVIWNRIVSKTLWEAEIVMENLTWKEAQAKEIEFIKLYGRLNNKTGILANMTDGGEGGSGVVVSEETRKKLSKQSKGRVISKETREKMASKLRGRPLPEWQRKILSEAAKKRDTYWCKKKIDQYDKNGNFIKSFDSLTNAAKELKLKQANITKVLLNKRTNTGGFVFTYHGQSFNGVNRNFKKNIVTKKVVDLETGEIYESLRDAAEKNNLPQHKVKTQLYTKKKPRWPRKFKFL